eukprot:TRINITY_DN945_c0_g1_i1.p1 TRINITY_DN945_c0_g1~~TRINITY_DN945_c0_g1_i1.p1  ORF type:complete len:348 (-),score=107.39 TRINITY_DN945_c0_g1_i1:184-1227(-)
MELHGGVETAALTASSLKAVRDCATAFEQVELNFECPICLGVMDTPTLTVCTHNFCRQCIEEVQARTGMCPICKRALTAADLHPDPVLRGFMESWKKGGEAHNMLVEHLKKIFLEKENLKLLYNGEIAAARQQHEADAQHEIAEDARRAADGIARARERTEADAQRQLEKLRTEAAAAQRRLEEERARGREEVRRATENAHADTARAVEEARAESRRAIEDARVQARADAKRAVDEARAKALEEQQRAVAEARTQARVELQRAVEEARRSAAADLQRDLAEVRAKAEEDMQREIAEAQRRASESISQLQHESEVVKTQRDELQQVAAERQLSLVPPLLCVPDHYFRD